MALRRMWEENERQKFYEELCKAAREFEGVFYNPNCLSLHKAKLSVAVFGKLIAVPAIHNVWGLYSPELTYINPPKKDVHNKYDKESVQFWMKRCRLLIYDMKYLLSLPLHRLWSTIQRTWSSTTLLACKSFLYTACSFSFPKPPHSKRETKMIKLYEEVKRLSYIVFLKLTVLKLSESEWFEKDAYGRVVYDNFIMTIPLLMDISACFADHNIDNLRRGINRVFRFEPCYEMDLREVIQFSVKNYFRLLESLVNNVGGESKETLALELDQYVYPEDVECLGEDEEVQIITFHLWDTTRTFNSFLKYYEKGAIFFYQELFVTRVAEFYEKFIPALHGEIKLVFKENVEVRQNLLTKFQRSRLLLLELVHIILTNGLKFWVKGKLSMEAFMIDLMNGFREYSKYPLFCKDFQALYPVEKFLDSLPEECVQFIDNEIMNNVKSSLTNYNYVIVDRAEFRLEREIALQLKREEEKAKEIKKKEEQLQSIFPDLPESFINKCLEYFKHDTETTALMICEGILPSPLAEEKAQYQCIIDKEESQDLISDTCDEIKSEKETKELETKPAL